MCSCSALIMQTCKQNCIIILFCNYKLRLFYFFAIAYHYPVTAITSRSNIYIQVIYPCGHWNLSVINSITIQIIHSDHCIACFISLIIQGKISFCRVRENTYWLVILYCSLLCFICWCKSGSSNICPDCSPGIFWFICIFLQCPESTIRRVNVCCRIFAPQVNEPLYMRPVRTVVWKVHLIAYKWWGRLFDCKPFL